MHQTHPSTRPHRKSRVLAFVLALTLLLGLVPGLDLSGGGSAHWADSYLSQLVEWGFIRPDQAQQPADELTRADFMAITNRAYGYHEPGPTPFVDIKESDWFYDDVGIAYTAKYIKGTSETTASPNDTLTRETAATILGRNMMLEESPGELLDFTDARDISSWSKGVIKSSLEHYLIGGYDDGTFRPQNSVTWGEMAAMLTRIVGTPLQEPGDYAMGGVFGNVTISSPGVTLRDTVISGDLYVTGGVGLGDIKLENVVVLGRIICSGTGEAEGGSASIILRNVTADELLIDNLEGKTVSVQADGITEIGQTTVRTSAYIEDNTMEGLGLKYISLEGHIPGEDGGDIEPPVLTLAGRIENVINKTPESLIHVGKGTVAVLNIDEAATDSQVTIDRGAVIKELNLDTAAYVDGDGDIKHLNVNAPGCEVTILPEEITIRPGTTAVINGEEMDVTAAEQANVAPYILAGYPTAEDIAPTTITAVFAANKKGTVYWAVSPISSGSVSAADLIKHPAYGAISVAHGSVKVPQAEEEVRAAVKSLKPGGSYYLSAVLVDEKGVQSPVKVIAFATPDNTIPAFCTGYPHMSTTSAKTGCQVVVMPTKTCNLYYALMPTGARQPTEDEFLSGSISGSLGYGVVPVVKNNESIFRVDDVMLEEQKEYVLYLWLVDADGSNKGKIVSLKFTTKDETLPYFIVPPTPNKVQANSVSLNFRLSEDGTVYWAVVPFNTEYPKKQPGHDENPLPSDMWSKLSVQNGYSALKNGSVSASSTRDGTITVSGLEKETAYDLYYVAVDKAGNYSAEIQKVTINTQDQTGPRITQTFTKYSGTDNTTNPMVDTGIILRVSENVRADVDGAGEDLLSLYQASVNNGASSSSRQEALDKLILSLRSTIVLNQVTSGTGRGSQPVRVKGDTGVEDNWVIDYEQVVITQKDNAIEITFPEEALQLENGSTYYFTATNLTDTSTAQNRIVPNPIDFYTNAETGLANGHDLRLFTIMLGQLYMTRIGLNTDGENSELPVRPGSSDGNPATAPQADLIPVDYSFRVIPQSTSKMEDNMCYDLLFYTDAVIDFDLYYRVVRANPDGSTTPLDLSTSTGYQMPNWNNAESAGTAGWYKLGSSGILRGNKTAQAGASLGTQFNKCSQSNFPKLNKLDDSGNAYYEFAVSITQKDTSRDRNTWSGEVNLSVYAAAAPSTNLSTLTAHPTFPMWDDSTSTAMATSASFLGKGLANGGGVSIGITDGAQTFLKMAWPFTDNRVPHFSTDSGYPKITPSDISADLSIVLDRAGTVDYVVAPREGGINATVVNHNPEAIGTPAPPVGQNFTPDDLWANTPLNGTQMQPGVAGTDLQEAPDVTAPEALSIAEHLFPNYLQDRVTYGGNNTTANKKIEGLMPDTDYYIYFVTSGVSTDLSDIYIYKFHTKKSAKPKIRLNPQGSGNVEMTTDLASKGYYRILTEQDAKTVIDFLKAPFTSYTDYGAQLPDVYSAPNFTVLEAISKRYSNFEAKSQSGNASTAYFPGEDDNTVADYEPSGDGGYTVFDIYANTSARTKMDNLIRNGQPGLGETIPTTVSWGPFGDTTMPANWGNHVLNIAGNLNSTSQYVILTLARSTTSNQSDSNALTESFSAASFRKMSLAPPNVTQVSMTDPLVPGSVPGTYSGKITVLFDSNVYVNVTNPDGTISLVALQTINPSELFSTMVSMPSGGTMRASNVNPRGFDLEFTNVPAGSTLMVHPERFLSADGGPATEPLKVYLDNTQTNRIFVTVTWGPDEEGKDKELKWSPLGNLNITPETLKMSLTCTTPGMSLGGTNPYYLSMDCNDTNKNIANIFGMLTPQPEEGSYVVRWTSNNTDVATVSGNDMNAIITAKAPGKATISVAVSVIGGGSVSATIEVSVGGSMTISKSGGGGSISGSGTQYTVQISLSGSNSYIDLDAIIQKDNPKLQVKWDGESGANQIMKITTTDTVGHSARIAAADSPSNRGGSKKVIVTADGVPTVTIQVVVAGPSTSILSTNGPLTAKPQSSTNDTGLNINKR